MDTNDALLVVFARNSFYKRLHFLVLGALFSAVLAIIILTTFLIHLLRNPTQPLYFAADDVGRLIEVIPVSKPNMSDDDVIAWTINAVESALSYDFINFRAQLQEAEKFFTAYGWRTYMDSVTASNNLVALKDRQMVFIAKVIDKPKITTKGILGGAYAWRMEFPVLMTYLLPPFDQTEAASFSNPLQVSVVVQRQPILQSYRGLGIVQVIANIAVGQAPQQQQPLTAGAPVAK